MYTYDTSYSCIAVNMEGILPVKISDQLKRERERERERDMFTYDTSYSCIVVNMEGLRLQFGVKIETKKEVLCTKGQLCMCSFEIQTAILLVLMGWILSF